MKIKFFWAKVMALLCVAIYGSFSYVYGIFQNDFYFIFKSIFLVMAALIIISIGNKENKK